jgi:hypothetical protein
VADVRRPGLAAVISRTWLPTLSPPSPSGRVHRG